MMPLFKKTLALASAFSILASATQVQAAYTDASYSPYASYSVPYKPSKELKKVAASEYKIMNALDSATKKELSKIRDAKLKKEYSDLAKAKKDGMRSIFSRLRSDMRYSFTEPSIENVRDSIRFSTKNSAELLKEIRNAAGAKTSPLAVSAEESANVEAGVLSFQKDLIVTPIRSFLDSYLKDGVKETGDWKASVETPYGKANLSLERYSNILSMIGLSQEADFVFKADYDLSVPSPASYDPETFEEIPGGKTSIIGGVMFDANVKIVGKKAYVLLRDYSLEAKISGSGAASSQKMEAGVVKAKSTLDLFKGKTVSIDLPSDASEMKPEFVLKKVREVLGVLESGSLFTPARRIGDNAYALQLNGKTVAAIAAVFDEKVSKGELKQANKELLASGLSFSEINGKTTISAIDPHGEGMFSVSKESAGYSLHLETLDRKDRATIDIAPTGAKLRAKMEGSIVSGDWNRPNGALSFTVSENGNVAFEATGTALLERMDLSFKLLGKDLGTLKMTKTGKTYSTDLALSFDIPNAPSGNDKVVIKSSQNATMETGTFNVEVPKDVIDIETLLR